MIERLKIVSQTLKGIGQYDDGELVHKAAMALENAHTVAASKIKELEVTIAGWKRRAEAAEELILKLKTKKPPKGDETPIPPGKR